ncbi:uncharacterized protein GGS22DRAFT_165214 [Annulohypoxylon maeteangense]|uniref:uncharacterized protein n=1 Tax=Annulohypoxylon maeteangense TaxID=1927788 RepID=UPI0020087474|nr:uncharacterized protein GGS22DRAFT_165214 [Annulohypoxylon maeteangense]KAI0884250.1 hypothetical protein GGS22DRAFT_165214 [Annulohypoxylon maeteangense]
MKFSTVINFLAATGLAVAAPSSHQTRSVNDVLPGLKRDTSGGGFTHVGSDNVVRTFDRDLNVVDFAQLDDRAPSGDGWPRSPSAAILDEVKQAKARSAAEVSKPRSRSPLEGRQQPSCVSENCPNDDWCKGMWLWGYNCTSCMLVSNNIGNCQEF